MSTINELLNQQKQIQAQIDAVDPDAIKKAQREKDKESMQADIDESNAGYDSQINNTQAYYDKRIGDEKVAYESQHQKNAVQKLINEKQIAERNANLGLTDSGLNRTQQTAAQLSYANQKGMIDLARQSALDELNLKLTDAITTLENDKATAARNITNNWNAYSDEQAQNTYNTKITGLVNQYNSLGEQITDMYKADADAAAEVQAAAIGATVKTPKVSYGAGGTSTGGYIVSSKTGTLSRDYMGSLKDNGVSTVYNYNDDGSIKSVTYTDSNSGISATFDAGVNPYTGKMNKDVRDEYGYYDPSKVFDNGYQPNNINGVKLKLEENNAINVNGQLQKVFKCGKKYYTWDGKYNEYFEVIRVELGDGTHKWEEKQ